MSDAKVLELITEIRRLSAFGQLARDNTITFPQAVDIIEFLEQGGEKREVAALKEMIAERDSKIAKLHGATGGLKKRINKLEAAAVEGDDLIDNNRRLGRIASQAAEFVTHLVSNSTYVDETGEPISEHPLFVRLVQELK
jgi:hypothetical protein